MAAFNEESHEEHPGSKQEMDTNVRRSQEKYITQVSEEIGGRVTNKVSQEFAKMKKRNPNAVFWFDEFFSKPTSSRPLRICSGDVPEHMSGKPGNEWYGEKQTPRVILILKQESLRASVPPDFGSDDDYERYINKVEGRKIRGKGLHKGNNRNSHRAYN